MEVKIEERLSRLSPNRFFGKVLLDWAQDIISLIEGKRILDIGCGYGFLVSTLLKRGFDASGIDISKDAIERGKNLYPGVDLQINNAYNLPFADNSFDSVVFHESIHHLEFERAIKEADRLSKGCIIIFDPNPNFVVKFCRRIVRHKDEEAPYAQVIEVLKKFGYKITFFKLRDVVAMPLSGGFVGPQLLPDLDFLDRGLINFDHLICNLLKILGCQKFFCWRYIIKAEKMKR